MKFRLPQFLVAAVIAVAALGGCELLVGLEGTDLASNAADAAISDAPFSGDTIEPLIDAGPPPEPIGGHDQTCAYGGANTYMSVSCNPGQVITGVTTALFGRFDGSCTAGFTLEDGGGSCPPTDAPLDAGGGNRTMTTIEAMEELCVGLRSCTFDPNHLSPVLNDPCNAVQKQFAIQITCGTIADAGADAGDITAGVTLDLDARDPVGGLGAAVTSWKNKIANETATAVGGHATPTLTQVTTTGGMPMVRFTTGSALGLPATNAGDPYLRDFSAGFTAFVIASPHGDFQQTHIFDFGSSATSSISFGSGEVLGLVYFPHIIAQANSVNGPGAWSFDYPQLYSVVSAPLPPGVVPSGNAGGATWGKTVVYQGTTAVGVGFQPLPGVADKTSNLLGIANGGGAADFVGDVGEIVVYDRGLSPVEMSMKQQAMITTWHLCDGADFTSDPANCGGCGNICVAGASCDRGICSDLDLSSWVVTNPSSGDAGVLFGPPDSVGVANASWAQARNTCILENSELVAPTSSDQNALLGGYFGSLPTTKNRAIGVIRENSLAISASSRGAASYDDFTAPPAWGCGNMTSSEAWVGVDCNASAPISWGCQAPTTTFPASCPTFNDLPRGHAYAFCGGPFPNETARRDACTKISPAGSELAVRDFTEAANVASLGMTLPASIDLTNVRKSPAWTLADGTVAPFIGWNAAFNVAQSIPPFLVGPACAVLNADGTMTDQSCFAQSSVVCGLPDGTPVNATFPTILTDIPGFIDLQVIMGDATHAPSSGQGTNKLVGVKPGDVISGIVQFLEIGRLFTFKIGLYPSNVTQCQTEDPSAGYPPVSLNFPVPALEGIYPLYAYPDSDCGAGWDDLPKHGPTIVGAIQVVAP